MEIQDKINSYKWQKAEAMIRDGWSFNYAMSVVGFGVHTKGHAYIKQNENYKRLSNLYKDLKEEKKFKRKEKEQLYVSME
jgi:hypothetical protein